MAASAGRVMRMQLTRRLDAHGYGCFGSRSGGRRCNGTYSGHRRSDGVQNTYTVNPAWWTIHASILSCHMRSKSSGRRREYFSANALGLWPMIWAEILLGTSTHSQSVPNQRRSPCSETCGSPLVVSVGNAWFSDSAVGGGQAAKNPFISTGQGAKQSG